MTDVADQVIRCDHCNRKVAEIRDGQLIVYQRHDREQHQTIMTLTPQQMGATNNKST